MPSLSPIQEGLTSSRSLISNEGAPAGARLQGVNSVHAPVNEQAGTDVSTVLDIGNPRRALTEEGADERGVISADPLGGGRRKNSAAVDVLAEVA